MSVLMVATQWFAGRKTGYGRPRGVDAATGTSVELGGPGGPLAHFIVGAGGLVRRANGQDVYRVATCLTAAWSSPPRDWRSRQITDIAHLRAIEWQVRAGTFRFERTGDVWAPVPLVREGDPTVHVVPYSEWKYDFVPSAVQRGGMPVPARP